MRKFYVFLGMCAVALSLQGVGFACNHESENGEPCICAQDQNGGVQDEASAKEAVTTTRNFLKCLKKGNYAKAWEYIDEESKDYVISSYTSFFPEFCQEHKIYANSVAVDFHKGGPLAAKYWKEMYKRDCQFSKINLNNLKLEAGHSLGGITVSIPDGNWMHSWHLIPDSDGNYLISIPRG